MGMVLTHGSFGEAGIQLLKLIRKGDRHELRDLSIAVHLTGDFESRFTAGELTPGLTGEAIGERVYALARDHCGDEIEPFAILLSEHFEKHFARVSEARVAIEEKLWTRLVVDGRPRNRAFGGAGPERRLANITRRSDRLEVEAGFSGVPILKTVELEDQTHVLSGILAVVWKYGWTDVPFRLHWQQVRQVVLEAFAEHPGTSMQHALHGMGLAALDQCPPVAEIRFSLAASTYRHVDLSRIGMDGTDDLLLPQANPRGIIEVTVRREEIV